MPVFSRNFVFLKKTEDFAPLIFNILLVTLGLVWILLGNTWYGRVVPFYDSLSYQNDVEDILRAYQANGWGHLPSGFLTRANGVLFELVIAVLAPTLPISRTTLYIYIIPLQLISLYILFNFLYRKTNSLTLAFLGPMLYLSTAPFRILIQGILDQRMDFATASFILILWCVALSWAENHDSIPKTVTVGVVVGLILLHRPIVSIQVSLAGLFLLIYAIWVARNNGNISSLLNRIAKIFILASIIFGPWLILNGKRFVNYYFVINNDVSNLSLIESFRQYVHHLLSYFGKPTLFLMISILITALVLRTFSWKYFWITSGLIVLPIMPLILSGSSNAPVAQVGLAGIGLLPLTLIREANYHKKIVIVFCILAGGVAIWNLIMLVKNVNNVDGKARQLAEETILNLNEIYPMNESKTYLSGFILAGGGPSGLASIARLDMGISLYPGVSYYHASEFNLDPRGDSFSDEELDRAVTCALEKVYERGGLLMLVEPAKVNEVQSQLIWPFSHEIAARINKVAIESGKLIDIRVKATLEGIPVRFYLIQENADYQLEKCEY